MVWVKHRRPRFHVNSVYHRHVSSRVIQPRNLDQIRDAEQCTFLQGSLVTIAVKLGHNSSSGKSF